MKYVNKSIVFVLAASIMASGFSQQDRAQLPHIKWTAQSVEYAALCSQAWRIGWEKVVNHSMTYDGKFAVVLDVDETIVSNTSYNVEHEKYDVDTWLKWVNSGQSSIVPGAAEFLTRLHAMPRVQTVFISNRWGREREGTERFMRKHGLLKDGDVLMMRENEEDTKEVRRKEVTEGVGRCKGIGPLEIAVLFGDQISDFYVLQGKEQAAKDRQAAATDPRWGRKFIIFPNPVYGSWEKDYQ